MAPLSDSCCNGEPAPEMGEGLGGSRDAPEPQPGRCVVAAQGILRVPLKAERKRGSPGFSPPSGPPGAGVPGPWT